MDDMSPAASVAFFQPLIRERKDRWSLDSTEVLYYVRLVDPVLSLDLA